MIFYFSGTGNSLSVAKEISKIQQESIISITKEMKKDQITYPYELKADEKIIVIFPIYAWAPPEKVIAFIEKLDLIGYENHYISCIATCGENIGNTMSLLQEKLNVKGYKLNSGFSLAMPNNYMMMGDVEKKENIEPKLAEAKIKLDQINEFIEKQIDEHFDVVLGPMPAILTKVINPFFTKYAMDVKQFKVSEDCIGCKLCEKICNANCITVRDKPIWTKGCTSCLACLNYCPKTAIQYGKKTIKKGRYHHPEIRAYEMYLNN
ncbi:MAG: EFR1 family ferrodoxin [Turicibacter sp.]